MDPKYQGDSAKFIPSAPLKSGAPRRALPEIPQRVMGQPSAKALSPADEGNKRVADVVRQQVEVKKEAEASPRQIALTSVGTEYKQNEHNILIPIDREISVDFDGSIEEESSAETVTMPSQPSQKLDSARLEQEGWTPEGSTQAPRSVEVKEVKSFEGRFEGVGKSLGNLIGKIINSGPVQGLLKLVSAAKEHVSAFFTPKDPNIETANLFIKKTLAQHNIPVHEEGVDKALEELRPGQGIVVKLKDRYVSAEKGEDGKIRYLDLSSVKDPLEFLAGLRDISQKNQQMSMAKVDKDAEDTKTRRQTLQAQVKALNPETRPTGERARSIPVGGEEVTPPRSHTITNANVATAKAPHPEVIEIKENKENDSPSFEKDFIRNDMEKRKKETGNEKSQIYSFKNQFIIGTWELEAGVKAVHFFTAPPNASLDDLKKLKQFFP